MLNPPVVSVKFFDRLRLFGMPAKHQPDFIYLRHVPLRKVHLFTIVQLSCLILLWVIKTSRAAIVFPMMVTTFLVVFLAFPQPGFDSASASLGLSFGVYP